MSLILFGVTLVSGSFASLKKKALLPGETTHGHYQIEMQCNACHSEGGGVSQEACMECHKEELDRVDDSHPVVKFKDPRNADRLKALDARQCITCHKEHQPRATHSMGLTLPEDYCFQCHQSIGEERPTHVNLSYKSCATAGCHNFHDNTALYESFLQDHLGEPDMKNPATVPLRKTSNHLEGLLSVLEADVPNQVSVSRELLHSWGQSAHAKTDVNCTQCHSPSSQQGSVSWDNFVSHETCGNCHARQLKGFLESRHGMRLKADFPSMTPEEARLPMKPEAGHLKLSCVSCHDAHRFRTNSAALEACLKCHDDEHSLAYMDSPHYTTWLNEQRGVSPAGTGVSCATCHLPRVHQTEFGEEILVVDHNQNNYLRPNEKMVRSSCIHCHGLQFSLNALADKDLVQKNFRGTPKVHVKSFEMIEEELMRTRASAK